MQDKKYPFILSILPILFVSVLSCFAVWEQQL